MVTEAAQVVVFKDAPILAASRAAGVDALVTLDKKHLLDRPDLETFLDARILRPQEAFQLIQVEQS